MRFSLRTFLLAVAYAALVGGALISRSATLSALAWSVTATAFCYAFVMLCFATGRYKALALGFVLLSSTYFAVAYISPARTLAGELFSDIGYVATEGGWYSHRSGTFVPGSQAIYNTLNAAATILVGVVGAGVGALAWRHSHEP
jgi:hypothetical protein